MSNSFHAVQSRSDLVIVGRLLPGSDLIRGLEEVCDEYKVKFAAILFAYGSLTRASFKTLQSASGEERPVLMPLTLDERVEFLGGQGLICRDEDGGRETHLHGSVADSTGLVKGGHFVRNENPIYNNLDFALAELQGVDLVRRFDAETQTIEMEVSTLES